MVDWAKFTATVVLREREEVLSPAGKACIIITTPIPKTAAAIIASARVNPGFLSFLIMNLCLLVRPYIASGRNFNCRIPATIS